MEEKLDRARRGRTGLILGKFMPPHRGHQALVEFGLRFVDRLTVLVCTLKRDPIPGQLRFEWMRELFPSADVVHVTDEVPSAPEEHPEFWPIWRTLIRKHVPQGPDFVFASEAYGHRLAAELGSTFIPVDESRGMVKISATEIRSDPLGHWEYLPECVRPYYVKRVCVFGPESTGKSTLARDLAERLGTVHVSEFARGLLDSRQGRCDYEDIAVIARGQVAAEEALARQARRVLVCDTDVLTTTIWSDVLFGKCPAEVTAEAERRTYDLYLLLDIDVPWVQDGQRYLPDRRDEFMKRCVDALESRGRKYVRIRGSWNERLEQSVRAIERLLTRPNA
jgi:NadR type nicotinamide-nucleotide adenylyltransferase